MNPRQSIVLAATGALVMLGGCAEQADPALRTVRLYDLVTALTRASVEAPETTYVARRALDLGGVNRDAIFMHPTSSVRYEPIVVQEHTTLTAFLAIDGSVKDRAGDGVDFTVTIELPDGVTVDVFKRYIDPRINANEQGWVPISVSLGAFAGQAIRVRLRTGPGTAGDNSYDWAFWGEPRLILDKL